MDALGRLEGKMWKKRIEKNELTTYKQTFQVISERLHGGAPEIRVFSETQPDTTFAHASPELEDVYFTHIAAANKLVDTMA
jgi:hypothetical protein